MEFHQALAEVAEELGQVEGLDVEWFVGGEFRQAVGVFLEIGWRNGPAFDGGPAEHGGGLAAFFADGQPSSVFVRKIEWQKDLLAVSKLNQQSQPFADEGDAAFDGTLRQFLIHFGGVERVDVHAQIVRFPGPGFRSDRDFDLIVRCQTDC